MLEERNRADIDRDINGPVTYVGRDQEEGIKLGKNMWVYK